MENSTYMMVISPIGLMLGTCLEACLEAMRYRDNMPTKNEKSDALIAYALIHRAFHFTSCLPSIVGSCMMSAALVVVDRSRYGAAGNVSKVDCVEPRI